MNSISLSWAYLKKKKLNTFLNIILLGLGVGTILFLTLIYRQISDKFNNNYKEINVVVGAKGSALGLILSSMYHVDNPVGNIKLKDVEFIEKSRFVEKAIKLSLGDNYKNFKIVGTEHSYPKLYSAELSNGKLWSKPMEVTIGAKVASALKLKIGDTFYGGHGGEAHKDAAFKVVGIFKANRTVIDKLILCDYKSFWVIHPKTENKNLIRTSDNTHKDKHEHSDEKHTHKDEHEKSDEHIHQEDEHEHDDDKHTYKEEHEKSNEHIHQEDEHKHNDEKHTHKEEHEHNDNKHTHKEEHEHNDNKHIHKDKHEKSDEHIHQEDGEITALLVKYKKDKKGKIKTMALVMVNNRLRAHERLQGAEPALEINKLFEIIGVGKRVIEYFAYILIVIAGLSVFIALYNALKERRYDLAIMRTLGGSKNKLFKNILIEGFMLVFLGGLLGFILAHTAVSMLGTWFDVSSQIAFTGLTFVWEELYIIALIISVGLIASLIPAMQVYKLDISETMSK